MRPNTPHLVMTPESSICYGGHFYTCSTIRETCYGLLHTFVASSLITNTHHTAASRDILRRLLTYFWTVIRTDYITPNATNKMADKYRGRVPDVFTFSGLIDLLSLCIIVELGNVLHYKTYTKLGLDPSERSKMIEGRAVARQIISWLNSTLQAYPLNNPTTFLPISDYVYRPYLVSQIKALCRYKEQAWSAGAEGNVPFSLEDLKEQIDLSLHDDEEFYRLFDIQEATGSFDWSGPAYGLRPVPGSTFNRPKHQPDETLGETHGDRIWKITQAMEQSQKRAQGRG